MHAKQAFLYISLPSLHDYDVKLPSSISPFVEDVDTGQRPSFSFPELQFSLLKFNCWKLCQHLTNWTIWNKRDKVWSSANSLFKWSFRNRRRRWCLSSLYCGMRSFSTFLIGYMTSIPRLVLMRGVVFSPNWIPGRDSEGLYWGQLQAQGKNILRKQRKIR